MVLINGSGSSEALGWRSVQFHPRRKLRGSKEAIFRSEWNIAWRFLFSFSPCLRSYIYSIIRSLVSLLYFRWPLGPSCVGSVPLFPFGPHHCHCSFLLAQSLCYWATRKCYRFDKPFEEVIYPKGDPDAVSISKRDVDLLLPDTFVNDTIIDFYIKWVYVLIFIYYFSPFWAIHYTFQNMYAVGLLARKEFTVLYSLISIY